MIRTHVRPIIGRDIPIGRKGENLARTVDFSDIIAEIKNDYGDGGKVVVLVKRPGEDEPYPAASVDESDGLTWQPTETDTAIAGRGRAEVDYYIDDVLVKSVLFTTYTNDSIGVSGDTPEPGYDYMKQLLDALEKVGTGIVSIEENEDTSITFHMSDGTEYTTTPLKGEDGQDGAPGEKGEPGAPGADGAPGEKGDPGNDGADGFSPTVQIADGDGSHVVTITDKDGAPGEKGDPGEPGADGEDGAPGADGADGVSPTVATSAIEGGTHVTITDASGAHEFDVMNGTDGAPGEKGDPGEDGAPGAKGDPGEDGADGFSPTVSVESIEGGHKVTITDAEGAHEFNVMDGASGGAATPLTLTGRDLYNLFQSSTLGLANDGTDIAWINLNKDGIDVTGELEPDTGKVSLEFTTEVDMGTGNPVAYGVNYNGTDGTYPYYIHKFCTFAPIIVSEALKPLNGMTLDDIYVYKGGALGCVFKEAYDQPFVIPTPDVPEKKAVLVPAGLDDGATVTTGDTVTVKVIGHVAPTL